MRSRRSVVVQIQDAHGPTDRKALKELDEKATQRALKGILLLAFEVTELIVYFWQVTSFGLITKCRCERSSIRNVKLITTANIRRWVRA